MTNKEAIIIFEAENEQLKELMRDDSYSDALIQAGLHRTIMRNKMAISSLKQTDSVQIYYGSPLKIKALGREDTLMDYAPCPSCGKWLGYPGVEDEKGFCPHCGQALLWAKMEEGENAKTGIPD